MKVATGRAETLLAEHSAPHHIAKMQTERMGGPVALALQGGGAHGAFASGVLDGLLEGGLRPDRICGVSSGALLGVMLVQGWVADGAAGARRAIVRLWQRVAQAQALGPVQAGPLDGWLWGADLPINPSWQGFEAAMQMFAPARFNPLRAVISDLLDPALLAHPSAPRLTVSATDVETGKAVLFGNREITVEALLASACLPMVWPAVEIGGRAFWDGAFSGNPPLAPLLLPDLPDELVLIRAQPRRRPGAPRGSAEIWNRISEIACEGVLAAELAALPPAVRLAVYDADAVLGRLPISSRFNADGDFLGRLFAEGRKAARSGARQGGLHPPYAASR